MAAPDSSCFFVLAIAAAMSASNRWFRKKKEKKEEDLAWQRKGRVVLLNCHKLFLGVTIPSEAKPVTPHQTNCLICPSQLTALLNFPTLHPSTAGRLRWGGDRPSFWPPPHHESKVKPLPADLWAQTNSRYAVRAARGCWSPSA